jgi:hypothetical protein
MNASSNASASRPNGRRVAGLVAAVAVVALLAVWQIRRAPPPQDLPPDAETPDAGAPPVSPTRTRLPAAAPSLPGPVRPTPETAPAEPGSVAFRLTAIVAGGEAAASVGIVDRETGQSRILRAGDETRDGWRLERVRPEHEEAVFLKDGVERIVRLSDGNEAEPAPQTADVPDPEEPEGFDPTAPASAPTPFSALTVDIPELGSVTATVYPANPDWVQLATGERRFAVRKEIATSISNIPGIDPEQQMRMLLTHPTATEVGAGADLVEAGLAAEKNLQEIIGSPPTEPPPIDELINLVNELKAADIENAPPAAPAE